jgi:heme/copper-type cytochrome/quinol oxidase subunit 3
VKENDELTENKNVRSIEKANLIFRWIMGIIFLLIAILAFSSCCNKQSFKYTNGIYVPVFDEEKLLKEAGKK